MKHILQFVMLGALLAVLSSPVVAEDEHGHQAEEQGHNAPADEHGQQAEEQGHKAAVDEHGQQAAADEHVEEGGVTLSPEQMALANIKVAVLNPRPMNYQVYAPGEVKANGYTSYLVSPRVDSVVLRRHAGLGDHVEQGQSLVTLFSESVAEAQAAFRLAASEWQRVKKLGRTAVGDKRFITAQTDYEAAAGRLLAYGLSQEAINSLAGTPQALGEYTLVAVSAGAVLADDFRQGQRVETGEALMELADEKELWIEAHLAPTAKLELPVGTAAQVKIGEDIFPASITQKAHTIDPQTRTRIVRLVVNNEAHLLHPGMFADVYFSLDATEPVLAVPESALMRGGDGDWTVFVEEETGHFVAHEVELGRSFGQWREISGLAAGSRVVMEGAFFVASEIAKSGFDPHDH